MSEWWTYRLTSFLLFSPRTYYRTIELYNLAIWPAHLAGLAIGLAVVALLATHSGWRNQIVAALLAVCWLWIGWVVFHIAVVGQSTLLFGSFLNLKRSTQLLYLASFASLFNESIET